MIMIFSTSFGGVCIAYLAQIGLLLIQPGPVRVPELLSQVSETVYTSVLSNVLNIAIRYGRHSKSIDPETDRECTIVHRAPYRLTENYRSLRRLQSWKASGAHRSSNQD